MELERKIRVLHFVTGGFTGGATQVAVQLVKSALDDPFETVEPLLVLRTKRRTPRDRVDELVSQGVPLREVGSWTHGQTIKPLIEICREFKPDIFVAHGFSEHIWGRMAALKAEVPHIVHIEHNTRERYTPRRLQQTHALAPFTDAFVGVSEGVKQALLNMGMPALRTKAIPNGINLAPFRHAREHPFVERAPDLVMVSRFSQQKDHITLIQALHVLKQKGYTPTLHLAGGGGSQHRKVVEDFVAKCDLSSQVKFLGVHRDVPGLLQGNQIFVMSTHWEGMPLALLEGMAAGMAVVATDVAGVKEVIEHDQTGLLVAENDPYNLADALQYLLDHPEAGKRLGINAHHQAFREHSRETMNAKYNQLWIDLFNSPVMASRNSTARG